MTVTWLTRFGAAGGRWTVLLLLLAGSSAAVRPGHWTFSVAALTTTGSMWATGRRLRSAERACRRAEQTERELMAYLLLDVEGGVRSTPCAKLVCQTVVARSPFRGAAVVLPDDAGVFRVAASAGMDDLSAQAVERWAAGDVREALAAAPRAGERSVRVVLERRRADQTDAMGRLGCEEVVVMPMWARTRLEGLLVVSTRLQREGTQGHAGGEELDMGDVVRPVEALAMRLTLQEVAHGGRTGAKPGVLAWQEFGKRAEPEPLAAEDSQEDEGARSPAGRRSLDQRDGHAYERPEISLRRLLERSAPPGFVLPPRVEGRAQGFFAARL